MDDLTGQTIGQYRLVQKLGEGGMAQVYKAYQPRLDRYVALKFIRPELAVDAHFRARFEQEARAIARLSHGHIVHIYDFGEEEKRYFLVMEFVEGQTLKEHLQALHKTDQWLTIGRAVELVLQIASALGYAHQQGIIHRDVKPDNVLLGKNGRPVLNDFGIARMIEDGGGQGLTQTGAAIGTPAYMAPEQIQGQKEKISAATDLYSLAIILYELLTGRTPFTADTAFAVMLKHLNDPIPLPRQLAPGLSEELERFLLKALAKEPEDRFPTAEIFADQLRLALAGSDSAAVPTPLSTMASPAQATLPDQGDATAVAPPPITETPPPPPPPPPAPPITPPATSQKMPVWGWALVGVLVLLLVGGGWALRGRGPNGGTDLPRPTTRPIDLAAAEVAEMSEPAALEPEIEEEIAAEMAALPALPEPSGAEIIFFTTPSGLFRVSAEPDAEPEWLSPRMEALFGPGEDYEVHVSGDGQWLLVGTTRGAPECAGWACLLRVQADLSTAEGGGVIYLPDYEVVHYNLGAAISHNGRQVLFTEGNGPNIIDLWLIEWQPSNTWSEPRLLTDESNYDLHGSPVFARDNWRIAMLCGDESGDEEGYVEDDICWVDADGANFETAVSWGDGPFDQPEGENSLFTPLFLPDGSLLFAATWRTSDLWRLVSTGEFEPFRLTPPVNDWLGCVLPSGRLVTLQWRENLNGPVLHIVNPTDGSRFTIETAEPLYYQVGCGG